MQDFGYPLGGMLATQVAGAATLATVPVLAPEIAAELGIDASFVGVYTGILFAASTLVLTFSGSLIARWGAVRTNQFAAFGSALALLIVLVPVLPALLIAAVVVGLAYGPNTPSSSQVLSQVVPVHRRALAFSIKQSGAPLGGMLVGLALPVLVTLFDWRLALLSVVLFAVVVAGGVEPLRRKLDARPSAGNVQTVSPWASLRAVFATSSLRVLVMGGFLLMIGHAFYQTFYVAYLVEGVGFSLTKAGVLYATLQFSGAGSRIVLGWLADRRQNARAVMVAVAACGAAVSLIVANFDADWSLVTLGTVSFLAGAGSSGWYGLFLAEVARRAEPTRVGLVTGGALFFVYLAVVAGPLLCSSVVAVTGSYVAALWLVAGFLTVAAGLFTWFWD